MATARSALAEAAQRGADHFLDGVPFAVEPERARFEARHVEQVLDEAVEPVRLLVEGFDEIATGGRVEVRAALVARVARERKLSPDAMRALVDRHTEGRFLGLLGEPRVNVLALNMALDGR